MRLLPIIALLAISQTPAAVPSGATPDVTVKVRDASDVAGDHFTLGEIADISSSGTDKAYAAEVAGIVVGTSPLPGQERLLLTGDIRVRIRFNHLDPKRIRVIAPPMVHVRRAGTEVPVNDLVQAATDKLLAERKKLDDGATVEPMQLPRPGFTGAGKREYQAVVERGSLERGPVVMQVTVMVDGAPVRTVEIPFRIKRGIPALMAKHALAPHVILTADDVTLGTVDAASVTGDPLTDVQAVVGKRTARQIAQGGVLTESCVELAPVITSGAQITLEFVSGGIHLKTTAIARTAGAVGQTIRVTTDTHKDFSAVVVDATTARVEDTP